jgi:hypothetical protein
VRASQSVDGRASSGSVVRVLGMPAERNVETDSGGEIFYE